MPNDNIEIMLNFFGGHENARKEYEKGNLSKKFCEFAERKVFSDHRGLPTRINSWWALRDNYTLMQNFYEHVKEG